MVVTLAPWAIGLIVASAFIIGVVVGKKMTQWHYGL